MFRHWECAFNWEWVLLPAPTPLGTQHENRRISPPIVLKNGQIRIFAIANRESRRFVVTR